MKAFKNYVQAQQIPFDVFLDAGAQIADKYRVIGLPTLFFIDKEGKVIDVRHYLPEDYQKKLLGLVP